MKKLAILVVGVAAIYLIVMVRMVYVLATLF